MNMHPILLIAAGPAQHTPALQRAYDMAKVSGSPVHIFVPAFDALIERTGSLVNPEVMRLAQKEFLDERRLWLERLAKRWRLAGLHVTTEVAWAPLVYEAILTQIAKANPSIVIKDVGHEPMLRRLLYTALDWQLLRTCPVPLLLVSARSEHLPRRILAAVDTPGPADGHTELNRQIVTQARAQADYAGASVHLVHSFAFVPLETAPYRSAELLYDTLHRSDRDAFDAFAKDQGFAPEFCHWLTGDPALQISDLVHANGVDLVVVGSSPHTMLDRLMLGSTSEALLYRMPCDVLLVKPLDRAAQAPGKAVQRVQAAGAVARRRSTGMRAKRR